MHFHRRSRLRLYGFAALGLLLGMSIWTVITRGRPQVVEAFPAPGAFAVPAQAPLRLAFDRPMNTASAEASLATEPLRSGSFTWDGNSFTFTPDFPWPRGQTVTITLATSARASSGINMAADYTWSFRTAPTLLAYLWPATGAGPGIADLYALDPVAGDVTRLTETDYGVLDYAPSPDGLSILLSLSNAFGGADLARLNLVTREITVIHECAQMLCAGGRYDPSGAFIAFENTTTGQVFLLQAGGEPVLVASGRFPAWSPSGTKLLAYDVEAEAYFTFDVETGRRVLFPNITGEPAVWSADGSFFLAPSITPLGAESFASHILRYDPPDTAAADLTLAGLADDNSPAISPDSGLVAFARRSLAAESWTPGRQLWVMDSDGGGALALTSAAVFNHTAMTWHPDGSQIAFVRSNQADLNEAPEIWLISADGSTAFQLVIGGFSPQWLP